MKREWTRRKTGTTDGRRLALAPSSFLRCFFGAASARLRRRLHLRRQVAKASGARHLILTHIPPLVDKARSKVSTSIQAEGPEAVQFAEDKMRVTVE